MRLEKDTMKIVEEYVNALKKAYYDNGGKKSWDNFERVMHGASSEDINKLIEEYPSVPDSLVKLLEYVDGTYWREFEGEKITFYILGSDVCEYPYYLLSVNQILESKNEAIDFYADYVDREYGDEVEVDERIIDCSNDMKWLHFSDCMNNGGTSQLFIDFSPSLKGIKGQVVRFLHDPDEIQVIADSFDEYLQMLIDNGIDFINEDTVE
jgi:cell wall assembly regulator SMI1